MKKICIISALAVLVAIIGSTVFLYDCKMAFVVVITHEKTTEPPSIDKSGDAISIASYCPENSIERMGRA